LNFTYDSSVNKLQSYNIEDKSKAKLTAEAGLNFAMARLRLYKEAFNFLEKNESAKEAAGQETINAIWNFPFVYPVPITDQMNRVQKDSLAEFMESSFIDGNLQLTIQNISNRININLLRVSLLDQAREEAKQEPPEGDTNQKDPEFAVEKQLLKMLETAVEQKAQEDEDFANQYYGMDLQRLVDILVTYLSDRDANQRPVENEFMDVGTDPKAAPMGSWSEIYSLPLWTDDLVDLLKNDFTAHGGLMIDLNKITDKGLRLLIPDLMEEDIEDFFKYKNDSQEPVFFNTVEQFKNYWVNQANIMSGEDFDNIFKKFEAQGLKFGPSPTIFRVISEGIKGRASYKLNAYVVIPAKPQPQPIKDADNDGVPDSEDPDPNDPNVPTVGNNTNNNTNNNTGNNNNNSTNSKEQKTQLLEPRIVEIFIN
ncbi:MAG: hypothetical protein WEB87_07075, partial [Bacteriovoracaceae bacterium]